MMKQFRRFLSSNSGNIAMVFGVLAVPIMLGIGVAIDTANLLYTRTKMQAAADFAAISGTTKSDLSTEELNELVTNFARQNGAMDVLQHVTDIGGVLDNESGTFKVRIKGNMRTSIMALTGISKMDVSVTSEATIGTRAMDVVLVLDTTGSMGNPASKIEALKSSAMLMIQTLNSSKPDFTKLRVGVVPFSEYVNVGTDFNDQGTIDMSTADKSNWQGCVASRQGEDATGIDRPNVKYPAVAGVNCTSPILDLTEDLGQVSGRINALQVRGNTYIPGGLVWGWNVLTPSAPFRSGYSEEEVKNLRARRSIVLMTDGANTISPGALYHDGRDVPTTNAMTVDLCKKIKADNIEIFTVSFMVTDTTIRNILQNCATTPAASYSAENAAQLAAAFQDIGNKLAEVRLSQ